MPFSFEESSGAKGDTHMVLILPYFGDEHRHGSNKINVLQLQQRGGSERRIDARVPKIVDDSGFTVLTLQEQKSLTRRPLIGAQPRCDFILKGAF